MLTFDAFLTTARFPGHTDAQTLQNALCYAAAAERLGFRGIWITEHHFIPRVGLCPSSLTMAAHLLGRTSTLRVGTAICSLPLYHPIQVAEQVALLDHLGGGRFDFGIGKGGFPLDLAVFDRDESELHPRLSESLDLIMRAWTEDRVEAKGAFVHFPAVSVVPRPRTLPHPPIYVVGQSPAAIDLAARHGLPIILSFTIDDAAKVKQLTHYAECAARYGHDPSRIEHACAVLAYVGDNRAEIDQIARPNLERFFLANHDASFLPHDDHHGHTTTHAAADTPVRDRVSAMLACNPVGTPEECVSRLRELCDRTGIRRLIVLCEWAVERERVLETMARLAGEVIPTLQPSER